MVLGPQKEHSRGLQIAGVCMTPPIVGTDNFGSTGYVDRCMGCLVLGHQDEPWT